MIHQSRCGSARARAPGSRQGILLGLLSLVTVAAAVLLAPVIPTIISHFAPHDPHAEAKVIFAMTVPSLMVALFSSFVGSLIDRFGRKNILTISLSAYGLIGIVPAFLNNLDLIIASRILLGIFEAMVMTTSTTLIGDYFVGKERQKWLAMQTIFVAVFGILFILLGGALGQVAWNGPFFVYGLFLIGVPFVIFLLHEPEKHHEEEEAGKFPWREVIGLYLLGLVTAVLFLVVPIQLPFLLTERGITEPLTISLGNMANSGAVLVGSIAFRFLIEIRFKAKLIGALVLIGSGIAIIAGSSVFLMTILGAILAGLGAGLVLPTLVTEIMSHLPFELRGRGTGRWQTAYFIGNFGSPLIVLGLTGGLGNLSSSLWVLSGMSIGTAMIAAIFLPYGSAHLVSRENMSQ